MKKKALITGITGQDGPYLAKLLLEKNYQVYGLLPRRSKQDFYNLNYLNIKDKIEYLVGDITDNNCMYKIISKTKPKNLIVHFENNLKVYLYCPEKEMNYLF